METSILAKRTRARAPSMVGGSAWNKSDPEGTLTHAYYTPFAQNTVDYIGKIKLPDGSLPSSHFDSDTIQRFPSRINRASGGGIGAWYFSDRVIYETFAPATSGYPSRDSITRINQNADYALRLVAETNPMLSVFSIPVAIKELAEVASMFELAAKSFAGYVGGAYLNYRFGWKAFVRDVKTLHGITKSLEIRLKDFERLLKQGGTRKRLILEETNGSFINSNVFLQSAYGVTVKGDVRTTWSLKTWGTVKWSMTDYTLVPVDELERFNRAVSTVFDIDDIDAETLWELIPFSWLVDYFYDIGTVLKSQHLRYRLQPYDICVMRHYTALATTAITSKPSSVSVTGGGRYLREIKSRDVVQMPETPSISFDLLTADRWKVILALAAKFASK